MLQVGATEIEGEDEVVGGIRNFDTSSSLFSGNIYIDIFMA
jgi:hypothetical protein